MIKLIAGLSFLFIGILGISEFTTDPKPVSKADTTNQTMENEQIDYGSFLLLTKDLEAYRQSRRISEQRFFKYAEDPETIILDTRSKAAFEESHLEGAIHLNFSDFTADKLAKVIPSKETRILIYCNNNFASKTIRLEDSKAYYNTDPPTDQKSKIDLMSLALKSPPLALNIPTFINLYGYGYENIYEMKSILNYDHPKLFINLKVKKK